jgi:hypothetical protein
MQGNQKLKQKVLLTYLPHFIPNSDRLVDHKRKLEAQPTEPVSLT